MLPSLDNGEAATARPQKHLALAVRPYADQPVKGFIGKPPLQLEAHVEPPLPAPAIPPPHDDEESQAKTAFAETHRDAQPEAADQAKEPNLEHSTASPPPPADEATPAPTAADQAMKAPAAEEPGQNKQPEAQEALKSANGEPPIEPPVKQPVLEHPIAIASPSPPANDAKPAPTAADEQHAQVGQPSFRAPAAADRANEESPVPLAGAVKKEQCLSVSSTATPVTVKKECWSGSGKSRSTAAKSKTKKRLRTFSPWKLRTLHSGSIVALSRLAGPAAAPAKQDVKTEGERALHELKKNIRDKRKADQQHPSGFQDPKRSKSQRLEEPETPPAGSTALERAKGTPGCPDRNVNCLMLKESHFSFFADQNADQCESFIMRTYSLRSCPQTFHVLAVPDTGTSCFYVGKMVIVSSDLAKHYHPYKDCMPTKADREFWATRIRSKDRERPFFAWKIGSMSVLDEPVPIQFASAKFRNRHFQVKKKTLFQVADVKAAPSPSLYSTSHFFLRLLSPKNREKLEDVAKQLDGCRIRFGTTCSGSEVGSTAVQAMLAAINQEFKVPR